MATKFSESLDILELHVYLSFYQLNKIINFRYRHLSSLNQLKIITQFRLGTITNELNILIKMLSLLLTQCDIYSCIFHTYANTPSMTVAICYFGRAPRRCVSDIYTLARVIHRQPAVCVSYILHAAGKLTHK